MSRHTIDASPFSYYFIADTRIAWFWLVARLYLGYEWFSAGWEKLHDPAWVGSSAGQSLTGFVQGALAKTSAVHPDVQGWYASFLTSVVLPHVTVWSYLVVAGELLVGAALILGFLVGVSAFFGAFMNLNFMLAGAVSINPIMYTVAIGLMLAWRVSGYWGLDYYVLPPLLRYLGLRYKDA